MNLGMSTSFGPVDLAHLPFPAHMRVDYIRVYQPEGQIKVGCDPKEFPTTNYINRWMCRSWGIQSIYIFSWQTYWSLYQPKFDHVGDRLPTTLAKEFVPWSMLSRLILCLSRCLYLDSHLHQLIYFMYLPHSFMSKFLETSCQRRRAGLDEEKNIF